MGTSHHEGHEDHEGKKGPQQGRSESCDDPLESVQEYDLALFFVGFVLFVVRFFRDQGEWRVRPGT